MRLRSLWIFSVLLAATQSSASPVMTISRASGRIAVDGRFEDSAWRRITPAPLGDAAHALLTYDDQDLYVGFRTSSVSSTGEEEWFAIVLDTLNERRSGTRVRVFSDGTVDAAVIDAAGEVTRELRSTATARIGRVEDGWTAELRVPFAELEHGSSEAPTWGLVLMHRRSGSSVELVTNSVVPEGASCLLCHASTLVGDIDIARAAERLAQLTAADDTYERAAFVTVSPGGTLELIEWPFRRTYRRATWSGEIPAGSVAIVHTHPSSSPHPSADDRRLAASHGVPVYALTRSSICSVHTDGATSCRDLRPPECENSENAGGR
jgi:proteasome lid subunit RPN8/RPN11